MPDFYQIGGKRGGKTRFLMTKQGTKHEERIFSTLFSGFHCASQRDIKCFVLFYYTLGIKGV